MAFQGFLKQSTAIDILLGPFLDETNGKDAETGLTIEDEHVRLSKNGENMVPKNEATDAVHDEIGYYNCPLDATDTATVGQLTITCHMAGALPVRLDYHIVEEAVYDAMYGGSAAGPLQSTTAARKLDVTATGATGIDWGNVENKTTANNLTGTNIKTDQKVDVNTLKTQTITCAAAITVYAYLGDGAEPGTSGGLATSDEVGAIANVGAATNEPTIAAPGGFTITTGLNEVLDEDSTHAKDGTVHSIEDNAGTMDVYYIFDIGGAYAPVTVTWHGRLFSSNDDLTIYVNTGTIAAPSWQPRGVVAGSNLATNLTHTTILYANDIMTGADAGKVAIRFEGTGLTSAKLTTDQITVQKSSIADPTGYVDGAVWYDDTAARETVVVDVDGTARRPVSTWAAVKTLLASTGLRIVKIANGSAATLDANSDNYTLLGMGWTLALGGQSIEGMYVDGANVSGEGLATVTKPRFEKCGLGVVTMPPSVLRWCGMGAGGGKFTAGSAGDYFVVDCVSMVAGSGTPELGLDGLGSASTWNMRRFSGGTNGTMDANMTASVEVVTGGGQTWVTGGGDLEIRGIFRAATITCSAAETVQIAGTMGPVTLDGTTTATVNIYGVAGDLADTRSTKNGENLSVSQEYIDTRSLVTADYATATHVTDIKGTGFAKDTHSLINIHQLADSTDGNVSTIVTTTGTILTDTNELQTNQGAWLTATGFATSAELADGTVQVGTVRDGAIGADAVADIFSTTAIVEAYAADAAAGTPAQVLYMIQQALTEFAISSTTLTVKKLDGSTTAGTYTLDSDTAPTSRTRAT